MLGRKESAVQQREMNGNSAGVLFSSPHQPNHLEKKKKKAFLHRVLVIGPEARHPLPIVVLAHISPLPEEQRLFIMGNCHSKAWGPENLLLGLEEDFGGFLFVSFFFS